MQSVQPVTTVVRRLVRPGKEKAYEAWLKALLDDARGMEGFLGADVLRPATPDVPVVSIYRFASPEALHAFETSDLRKRHMAKLLPLVAADAELDRLSGLEIWFDPPPGAVAAQPIRWRMALLLIVVVTALVLVLRSLVLAVVPDLPILPTTLLIVTCQVLVLTYVVMPLLTRAFAAWLFPHPNP